VASEHNALASFVGKRSSDTASRVALCAADRPPRAKAEHGGLDKTKVMAHLHPSVHGDATVAQEIEPPLLLPSRQILMTASSVCRGMHEPVLVEAEPSDGQDSNLLGPLLCNRRLWVSLRYSVTTLYVLITIPLSASSQSVLR
jgi:hypothetical protein